jgi:hypothetical protein
VNAAGHAPRRRARRLAAWLGPAATLMLLAPRAPAADDRLWAVLIGVQDYDDLRLRLNVPLRDVDAVEATLAEYAGLTPGRLLKLDDRADAPRQPTAANVRRLVPQFLARPGPRDRVLVFFSGHGFVDASGRAYLGTRDCDPGDLEATAPAVAEVCRALGRGRAAVKCLILDCCVPARDPVAGGSPEADGLVVLTSGSEGQTSWEWPEVGRSLFTAWLCQGLAGAADRDGGGSVSPEELGAYTRERVSRAAPRLFGRPQTPGCRLPVAPPPALVRLTTETAESLGHRLAGHLDLELRAGRIPEILLSDFEIRTPPGDRGVAAAPARTLSEHLHGDLVRIAGDAYRVRSGPLGSGPPGGGAASLSGTVEPLGPRLRVRCELVSPTGWVLATFHGSVSRPADEGRPPSR